MFNVDWPVFSHWCLYICLSLRQKITNIESTAFGKPWKDYRKMHEIINSTLDQSKSFLFTRLPNRNQHMVVVTHILMKSDYYVSRGWRYWHIAWDASDTSTSMNTPSRRTTWLPYAPQTIIPNLSSNYLNPNPITRIQFFGCGSRPINRLVVMGSCVRYTLYSHIPPSHEVRNGIFIF